MYTRIKILCRGHPGDDEDDIRAKIKYKKSCKIMRIFVTYALLKMHHHTKWKRQINLFDFALSISIHILLLFFGKLKSQTLFIN